MKHELIKLKYAYNALEPFMDAKTLEIHHGKHHQTYVDKLNAALANSPELQDKKLDELLMNLNNIPENIRNAVKNHGGGVFNHNFFWEIMTPNLEEKEFKGNIVKAIEKNFGSFDKFKEEFSNAALNRFGSGWAWLVVNNNELEIMSTANQDSPISEGKTPILGIDMWEHAMYLRYQNRKPEYLEAFFNVINWEQVEENYMKAMGEE